MRFSETTLTGVFTIDLEPARDERGYFARAWCSREFAEHGLESRLVQCSVSFNAKRGTLRGIHYQAEPFAETKLVRCSRGALYDVVVDLRPDSPTYKCWTAAVLSAENLKMMFVPKGCGHGFLTLQDETEVFYQMSEFYAPEYGRGVRWNDPAFGIDWPGEVAVISSRDFLYPDFASFDRPTSAAC